MHAGCLTISSSREGLPQAGQTDCPPTVTHGQQPPCTGAFLSPADSGREVPAAWTPSPAGQAAAFRCDQKMELLRVAHVASCRASFHGDCTGPAGRRGAALTPSWRGSCHTERLLGASGWQTTELRAAPSQAGARLDPAFPAGTTSSGRAGRTESGARCHHKLPGSSGYQRGPKALKKRLFRDKNGSTCYPRYMALIAKFAKFMVCAQPTGASLCQGSTPSLHAGRTHTAPSGRLQLRGTTRSE